MHDAGLDSPKAENPLRPHTTSRKDSMVHSSHNSLPLSSSRSGGSEVALSGDSEELIDSNTRGVGDRERVIGPRPSTFLRLHLLVVTPKTS